MSSTVDFSKLAANWNKQPGKLEMVQKFTKSLKEKIQITPDMVVMDFGCGTGLAGLHLIQDVKKVIFVDNNEAMLSVLRESTVQMNANNFEIFDKEIKEYNGEKVDLLISMMVFHHVDNVEETLNYLRLALKPGGTLVICDLKPEGGKFHEPEIVPHNGFDPDELAGAARKIGFAKTNVCDADPVVKPWRDTKATYERFTLFAEA